MFALQDISILKMFVFLQFFFLLAWRVSAQKGVMGKEQIGFG